MKSLFRGNKLCSSNLFENVRDDVKLRHNLIGRKDTTKLTVKYKNYFDDAVLQNDCELK